MNRIETTASSPAQDQRHSPLYRRMKIAENVRKEDLRDLCYSRELIDDRYDADLRKQFGWGA